MNKESTKQEYIEGILKTSRLAVLATESDGQPHTSLIAITPFENYRQLVFATYRNTRKYRNLEHNSKVAVLIEGEYVKMRGLKEKAVLTIIGHAEDINLTENDAAYLAHLKRHPEMKSFMLSSDCALIRVIARSYQLVLGIDDIYWMTAEEMELLWQSTGKKNR